MLKIHQTRFKEQTNSAERETTVTATLSLLLALKVDTKSKPPAHHTRAGMRRAIWRSVYSDLDLPLHLLQMEVLRMVGPGGHDDIQKRFKEIFDLLKMPES